MQLDISELKYVLFDWDNTLAESRSSLVCAVDKILADYNLPCWKVSMEKRDRNLSFKDNFPRIFGKDAAAAYEKYREVYKAIVTEKITTFEKVREVLNFLTEHHIKIMIVTNKERILLEYELPLLFDEKMFCNIVCGHEASADKPSGRHALYALQNFMKPEDINRKNVWVVGDSPQDSAMALAIGALPIRINKSIWGDMARGEDKEDIVWFDSFSDFYAALKLAKN